MAGAARRIIDISLGIEPGMPVWPDDPPVELESAGAVAAGDPANVSALRLGTHTGTHVDPPAHFFDGGRTVDQLDLDVLVGPATVLDLSGTAGPIGPAELGGAGLADTVERVLLRTDNSDLWRRRPLLMPERYVTLSPAGARWLVDRGVRLVGADFLSVESPIDGRYPVHELLLGAGVVLVEGLDLSAAPAGDYLLACLPLKVTGGDGAPARAVLLPSI
jgi:arylformamidase